MSSVLLRQRSAPAAAEVALLAARLPGVLRLAAVVPGAACVDALHPREARMVADESSERREQFAAGRHCARTVLASLRTSPGPLLRLGSGAPDWPSSVRGSISHKSGLCVAVAGPATWVSGVGIDVEHRRRLPESVWVRVFTPSELQHLATLPPELVSIRARLMFSAKESYYKWHGSQGGTREPAFGEVEVRVLSSALHLVPVTLSGLPEVRGCFVEGDDWLVTVLWSEAISA